MTPTKLVERVARAMWDVPVNDHPEYSCGWDEGDPQLRAHYMDEARAAIAIALEEAAKVADEMDKAIPAPRSYELAHYVMGLQDCAAAIRALIKD